MNRRNYQKELDTVIGGLGQHVPTLLLHSCCAPCSSYVLEYLSEYFSVTVFYYNPNITEKEEYEKRVEEVKRLIREMPVKHEIRFMEGRYEPDVFFDAAKGLELCDEGGERCGKCFRLRLAESCRIAAEGRFDFVTTTLSISPLKNAELLNTIGEAEAKRCGVRYLPSDFKKRDGYKRSIELSKLYGLYRQDYCGCIFSERKAHEERL